MLELFRDLMIHSELLALPLVALFLFIAVFAGIVVRVMRQPPSHYAAQEALPLGEDRHE